MAIAHRRTVITALAVAGALAVCIGATASAANGSPNPNHFTLYNHDTHQAFLDLGDPGPSVGDQYVFGGDVSEQQGGTPIGRMSGQCVTISDTEMLCTSSFTFNGGQISFQALVDVTVFFAGQPFEFALTGGTGPYRKARGTVTGQILPEPPSGSDARFTIDLE
ncbi:MAG TPA: hypothetical protein VKK31_26285 [Thermoanaerobaculia bacterium]|nr:hypothetical protein [Thermoanaerobaculia bacterium]